jgi:GDP-L-fucose synthase
MVGSAIVRELKRLGYSNLILKTRAELELMDQAAVTDFFQKEKPEYVILAAAKVGGIAANMASQADFLYENMQIQNNVIWSAHTHNVKKFMFLGTSCMYPRNCPQPAKEEYLLDGKPEPTNEGYALAKIAGLKLCEKLYEQYGDTFISCMPTNIYGPNDDFDPKSGHVISSLMHKMHTAKQQGEKEVSIWGSGAAEREFLFVDDLAQAVVWMMNNYEEKAFLNIGTGSGISIKELAILLKEIVGYEGDLVFDTTKPDGAPRKFLDTSKINALGWKASTELKAGLQKTYAWHVENQT